MNNPAKETRRPLPKEAKVFLKKLANRDLTRIQALTNKIHLSFLSLHNKELSEKEFKIQVEGLLHDAYEHIQDLCNLNIAFPTLFSEEQNRILEDLMMMTKQLNLQYPNAANYTEFENGQLGGAATIMQQQWVLEPLSPKG